MVAICTAHLSGPLLGQNTFPASGNVGIGTAAPSNPLTISYSDNSFNRGLILQNTNTGADAITGLSLFSGTGGYVGGLDFLPSNFANGSIQNTVAVTSLNPHKIALIAGADTGNPDIYFQSGPAAVPAIYIKGLSSNVGIGTTNPQSKLAVNGTITAKEVIVTNTGWSDYVFRPNYDLKPLSEVGAFVKEHHHLPEIPSEAEVKEKGVSLGDMQAKLLAKIEELTLHMIKAEERNRELQERIARLEARSITGERK